MRTRFVLLVVAILLVAGFAALNWGEIVRPSTLLLGPVAVDAPMGAILLGLLALAVVVFALAAASMRTHTLLESRHHYKELEAQRALADKAEASRFTDLRSHLDNHMRELRERDSIAATELEKARLEHRREINTQLEQINRTLSARLNELEHRLETRFERMGYGGRGAPVAGATPPVLRNEVDHPQGAREHAVVQEQMARDQHMREQQAREQQVHQAQMRDEERMRDERIREEQELRREEGRERLEGGDRKPESGWRRWF
jgi:hypothetical protein